MVLGIGLNGFVYPFPTFACTLIFFFGRIMFTQGTTNKEHGKKGPKIFLDLGFILFIFSQWTLISMLLIVAIKGMNAQNEAPATPEVDPTL